MNALQVLARAATPADSEAISILERECLVPPWTRVIIDNLLSDKKYFCIVITIDNKIIGHVIAWNVGDDGEIDRLAIAHNWRRRGLGARLLDDLVSIALSRGVRQLFLEVREDNIAAQQLYLGRGFEIVGARPDYYPDGSAALVMKRILASENGNKMRDS